MHKLKIFLTILLIFFFAGCSPKLNYTILDGKITESIEVNFDKKSNKEEIEQTLSYYSQRENIKANIEIEKIKNGYKGKIKSQELSIDEYVSNDTTLINECYEKIGFVYEEAEGRYYLNTSKGFQCMIYDYNVVDELTITIQTYNKVYNHNADEVNHNKYIWHITKDNADEQNILFVVGNKQYVWYYRFKDVFIGVALIIIIVVLSLIANGKDA